LVLQRLQFGLEPLAFRRGATRVLARVAGRPREEAPVTAEDLRQDFRLDAAGADALLHALVASRLLERANATSDYRLTERFREFALARLVPPLQRARAKRLIERAGMPAPPPIFGVLRVWSESVRRRIGRHRSDGRPVDLN